MVQCENVSTNLSLRGICLPIFRPNILSDDASCPKAIERDEAVQPTQPPPISDTSSNTHYSQNQLRCWLHIEWANTLCILSQRGTCLQCWPVWTQERHLIRWVGNIFTGYLQDLQEDFIKCIEALYFSPTARIRVNGHLSQMIYLKRGTHQGCPLSPLYLHYLLNPGLKQLDRTLR